MSMGISGSPDWDPMAAISQFQDQKISKTQSDIAGLGSGATSGGAAKPYSSDSFGPAEFVPSNGAQNASSAQEVQTPQSADTTVANLLNKLA
jgi:hypothetical protein